MWSAEPQFRKRQRQIMWSAEPQFRTRQWAAALQKGVMMSVDSAEITHTTWRHSPIHYFVPGAAYIVTAGTYTKARLFDSPDRKSLVLSTLFEEADKRGWRLEAWAVMANHYHFVARAPEDARTLTRLIQALHARTAGAVNRLDNTPNRRVWFQYWDTCLTHESSYHARLHYVHQNPVKHGLVERAEDYPWCSMGWLLNEAEKERRETILDARCDRISIIDDF
jgi:putative transposase